MRGVLRSFVVVLALVLGSGVAADAQTKLKASESVRYFGNMPIYTMMDGGFLKDRGLALELITMKGGPAAANALVSGDVDIATGSLEQAVKMKAKGQDVKVIGSIQHMSPFGVIVPVSSPVKTLADLKGKSIGVTATGSSSDIQLRAWIRGQKMDPDKDFQIVGLGAGSTVMAAYERGQVAAAIMLSPFLTKELADGKSRVLADFRRMPYHTMSLIVRTADLASPKAAQLRSFFQAMAAAQKALYEDPALATRVAKAYFPDMDPKLLEAMIKAEIQEFASFPKDGRVSREGFDNVVTSLMAINAIDRPVKYEDLVVTTFWQ